MTDDKIPSNELIIIDEVGPMELRGGGWAPSLLQLSAMGSASQLWVVRKPLLNAVTDHWEINKYLLLDINEENVEIAAERIKAFLKE